jgi:hypothetical protein
VRRLSFAAVRVASRRGILVTRWYYLHKGVVGTSGILRASCGLSSYSKDITYERVFIGSKRGLHRAGRSGSDHDGTKVRHEVGM